MRVARGSRLAATARRADRRTRGRSSLACAAHTKLMHGGRVLSLTASRCGPPA